MDEIAAVCPDCNEETFHEVLKAATASWTLRCDECHHVHSVNPPRMRTMPLKIIISHEDQSWPNVLETPTDETIHVGDEFELDGHRMLVTGIDTGNASPKQALATDIKTVFAKTFDKINLKLSVNEGEVTRSYQILVKPEFEVPVGLVLRVDDRMLAVKTIKSDQNRTLHKGFLLARNIRRAFCDPAPPNAKVGDVVRTRQRGKKEGSPNTGPKNRIKTPRGLGPRR